MEQTSKALAIKKLQTELKEEKQAEIQRCESLDSLSGTLLPLTPSLVGDGK